MLLITLFLSVVILSSTSDASSFNDFCVADLNGPESPSGYNCKPPNTVTTDNFVSNLRDRPSAFVTEIPGLNGQGISLARAELVPGGMFGMHTHPGASELILVEEGEITVGFMRSEEAYVKTLIVGNVMLIPRGLLHFVLNTGKENCTFTAFYSSENPTFQFVGQQLFGTNVPSYIIAQTTPLDLAEVTKQKARFGGTG
ncbi:hypothetical protein Fmac_010884 [Flemingia macrophylla]|uniref:Germin-like protein n=1 Tax=Flemingia macrophylla TaxID=520843 RepID=A0ABD1MLQ1_9FABA